MSQSEPAKPAPVRIAGRLEAVGDLPPVVSRLLEAVRRDDADAAEAARIVDGDATASRALALLTGPSAQPDAAKIERAGLSRFLAMVLSLSAWEVFAPERFHALDRERHWRHSVAVAAGARYIAQKSSSASADDAWLAGMLHDVGRAALDVAAPEEFAKVLSALDEPGAVTVDVERRTIGLDHAAVGEFVLRRWRVPEVIVRAVGFHHSESLSAIADRAVSGLASAVQAADFLAWAGGFGGLPTAPKIASTPVIEKTLEWLDAGEVAAAMTAELRRFAGAFAMSAPDASMQAEALLAASVELGRLRAAQRDLETRFARKKSARSTP